MQVPTTRPCLQTQELLQQSKPQLPIESVSWQVGHCFEYSGFVSSCSRHPRLLWNFSCCCQECLVPREPNQSPVQSFWCVRLLPEQGGSRLDLPSCYLIHETLFLAACRMSCTVCPCSFHNTSLSNHPQVPGLFKQKTRCANHRSVD